MIKVDSIKRRKQIKTVSKCFLTLVFIFFMIVKITAIVNTETKNIKLYSVIEEDELSDKLSKDEVVIVYFYQENCSPCNLFKDILNQLIEENNYDIYALNIDKEASKTVEVSDKYSINVTPTIIIYNEGKEVQRIEGLVSDNELEEFLYQSKR